MCGTEATRWGKLIAFAVLAAGEWAMIRYGHLDWAVAVTVASGAALVLGMTARAVAPAVERKIVRDIRRVPR